MAQTFRHGTLERETMVASEEGLHARPAARFVDTAKHYLSENSGGQVRSGGEHQEFSKAYDPGCQKGRPESYPGRGRRRGRLWMRSSSLSPQNRLSVSLAREIGFACCAQLPGRGSLPCEPATMPQKSMAGEKG
jgi:hypothetical protein